MAVNHGAEFGSLELSQQQQVEQLWPRGRLLDENFDRSLSLTDSAFVLLPIDNQNAACITIALADVLSCLLTGQRQQNLCICTFRRCGRLGKRRRKLTVYELTNALKLAEDSQQLRRRCAAACTDPQQQEKPLLFLVNPRSGSGSAVRDFDLQVAPMLREAGVQFLLRQTERVGHATKLVEQLNLKEVAGIVAVGGDGILYEIVNGLATRNDWRNALQVPVGVLPAGSGNAVASSLAYAAGECIDADLLLTATFCLTKSTPRPMDLMALRANSGRRFAACLSLNYGMLAEVDIDSERYRLLGVARFAFCFLLHLLYPRRLPRYRARLSYLPATADAVANAVGAASADFMSQCRHLPATNDMELPSDAWVTIDAEFTFVLVSSQSHLATDNHFVPGCEPNDGLLYVTFVRSGVSRCSLLRMLLQVDSGQHVEMPHWNCVPAVAFRLEPVTNSQLVVDGEAIPCEAIDGELVPSGLRVLQLPV